MQSSPDILQEFRRFNRLLFGNSLRHDVLTYWDALDGLDAELSDEIIPGKFVLRINTAFAGWKNQWRILLVHEMAHLHLWPYELHGEQWDREIQRIAKYKSYRRLL
jgi:hypothetical protein